MRKSLLLLSLTICTYLSAHAQTIRYVAPNSVGTADGITAANAADFLNASFWTDIQSLLQTDAVEVKFAAGNYERAYTEKSLTLSGIGNAKNRLTLEGAPGLTTQFTAPLGYETKAIMFWLYNSQNITVKNFYFTGDGSINYVFRVTSGSGKASRNILIENCMWEDMRGIIFGASGSTQSSTSYITYKNCTFKRIGLNSGSHMIYNAYDSHHISIIDSHFEDCTGDYVRFRDNLDYAVVKGSTFLRNPSFTSFPFIAMPLFNDVDPGDEIFATHYSFSNNTFTNATTAIQFYSSGFDPVGRNHLLTAQEGALLTAGTDQEKKDILRNNFKINTDLVRINGNTYNAVTSQASIVSKPAYGSVSKGWTGEVDISNLFNNSNLQMSWETDYENLSPGAWVNGGRDFSYNLGAGTGTGDKVFTGTLPLTAGGNSVSTEQVPGFLPYIPLADGGGSARVGYPSSNAIFTLQDSDPNDATLKINSSGSGNPAKFSLYNITNTSPVTSLFFTLSFKEGTYQQVEWTAAMGNNTGASNILSSASSLTSTSATSNPEVFNAFKWRVARTNPDIIDFQYRNKPLATGNASYTTVNSTSFYRGGEFAIEVYANNHANVQRYTRGGTIYEIPSRMYHVWSNGERILTGTDNYNFPANQLAVGTDINSFMIFGTSSSSTPNPDPVVADNSAELVIGKVKMNFASLVPLPITLTSFEVKKQEQNVLLNWQTSSERNNSHFEVLRSIDGKNFDVIGMVNGAGNSNSLKSYSFWDKQPFNGTSFYRLRQVDYDGSDQFSRIKYVNFSLNENSVLQVVSTTDLNRVQFLYNSAYSSESNLRIYNMQGIKCIDQKLRINKGLNNFSVDINLPPGVYTALLRTGQQSVAVKFIR